MNTTIRPWGNSQGLYIPKRILNQLNFGINETVTMSVENGALVIRKQDDNQRKQAAYESLKRIRSNRADRSASGSTDYRREYEEYLDGRYNR